MTVLAADEARTGTVLAADTFKTNSQLMLACRALGYVTDGDNVADVTYGKGTWWKDWKPEGLTEHDIENDGVDFRQLPEADDEFDVVAFDPPYVAVGGRTTSTIGEFNQAYGLVDVPRTPAGLHMLMVDGLTEIRRVTRHKGLVLFKCMNYVTSGAYNPQAYAAVQAAIDIGYGIRDEFIHLRRPGPQPKRDKQLHARRNYSHLFVLEARKK